MTKKSSKCSERMIFLYTLRKFKTRRDQFQDSVEGNCFFFLTVSNYTAIFVKEEEFSSIICMTLVLPQKQNHVQTIAQWLYLFLKINLEDTMHQHFVINHVKRKLQKYKTMYFIKKKLKSTMWCQVNKLLIFQFLLKNLFYEKNV